MAWKHVTGMVPTVLCVDDGIDPIILAKIVEYGGEVVPVSPVPKYGSAGIAQLSRIYAYAQFPGDYIMTTDVDAWPLSPIPYEPSGKPLDVYKSPWPMLPIGYIGAMAATWREFMGHGGTTIDEAMGKALASEPDVGDAFNADEKILTRRILAWSGCSHMEALENDPRYHVVVRDKKDPPKNRVWFRNWPKQLPPGMTDAHLCSRLHHPTWEQLRQLLEYVSLPPALMEMAEAYNREVPKWQ
jgi:hypothetical protein